MPTKYRDGYSSTGRQGALWLAAGDQEFSQKRTIDARVTRCGDFIQVFKNPDTDVAAVYSVGRNVGGTWQVRGAANAVGLFQEIGAPLDGVSLLPNLGLYGKGLMYSMRAVAGTPAVVQDFAGNDWNKAAFEVFRSRRGVEPEGYYSADAIVPNFLTVPYTHYVETVLPGWRDVAGAPTFYQGLMATQMASGGNPSHLFVRDDGVTQALGATLGYPSSIAWYATGATLAPGVLVKFDRYLRAGTPYFGAPVLVVTKSNDAGATWAAVASHPLVDTELATINALANSGTTNLTRFNEAAAWLRIHTAPLSRATSVVVAVVPYMDGTTLKSRVKMGTIDSGTGSMTGTTVLLDNATPANADVFFRALMAVPDGVLIFTRPLAPDSNVWSRPARIQITTNGSALADVGTMPLVENRTGTIVRALSERRIVATGYDAGAHRLYQSTDNGATWTRRAVISDSSRPPQTAENGQNLADFADVVYPRQGQAAINALPATPWLTDIRIDHA